MSSKHSELLRDELIPLLSEDFDDSVKECLAEIADALDAAETAIREADEMLTHGFIAGRDADHKVGYYDDQHVNEAHKTLREALAHFTDE